MLAGSISAGGAVSGGDSALGSFLSRRKKKDKVKDKAKDKVKHKDKDQASTQATSSVSGDTLESFPEPPPATGRRLSVVSADRAEPAVTALQVLESADEIIAEFPVLAKEVVPPAPAEAPPVACSNDRAPSQLNGKLSLTITPEYPALESGDATQSLTVLVTVTAKADETETPDVEEYADVVIDLERRVAGWNGLNLMLAGRLRRFASLKLGRGIEWRPFRCYLFENLLVCVVEIPEEKRTDPVKTLLVKGYIVLSHISKIDSEAKDSLTVHVDNTNFTTFRILFTTADEKEVWLKEMLELRTPAVPRSIEQPETALTKAYQPVSSPPHLPLDLVYLVPANERVSAVDMACLRDALSSSVARLSPSDNFALVVYGTPAKAEVLIGFEGSQTLESRLAVISQLETHDRAVDALDLEAGLRLVQGVFLQPSRKALQHVVLLASCSPTSLMHPPRCAVHVFDYGSEEPFALSQLVRDSHGSYTQVDSIVALKDCLLACLAGLVSCQHPPLNVMARVPGREKGVVKITSSPLGGKVTSSGRLAQLDLFDLMLNQSRDFILTLEVQPDHRCPQDPIDLLAVHVSRRDNSTDVIASESLRLCRTGRTTPAPAAMLRRVEVTLAGMLLRAAKLAGDGKHGLCERALIATRKQLHQFVVRSTSARQLSKSDELEWLVREVLDLDEDVAELLSDLRGEGDAGLQELCVQALHRYSALDKQRAWCVSPSVCRKYADKVDLIREHYDQPNNSTTDGGGGSSVYRRHQHNQQTARPAPKLGSVPGNARFSRQS